MTDLKVNNPIELRKKKVRKATLTTINDKSRFTTYKVSPVTMRFSIDDKTRLTEWTKHLSDISGGKITPAKLLQGLMDINDQINEDALIEAIKKRAF